MNKAIRFLSTTCIAMGMYVPVAIAWEEQVFSLVPPGVAAPEPETRGLEYVAGVFCERKRDADTVAVFARNDSRAATAKMKSLFTTGRCKYSVEVAALPLGAKKVVFTKIAPDWRPVWVVIGMFPTVGELYKLYRGRM